MSKVTGEQLRVAMICNSLAFLAYHRQEYSEAVRLIKIALMIDREMKNDYEFVTHMATLAGPTAALGAPEQSARLLGASDGLCERMGVRNQVGDQPEIDRITDTVRRQLGEIVFEEAWQAGRNMTPEQAVSFAFGLLA